MKKLLLVAFVALFILSSCSKTFYQVYTVETPGLSKDNAVLVYENEDCKVLYNLWQENGNIGFMISNKMEKDLFLILPQTFFIKNGIAYDYFLNREMTMSNTNSVSIGKSLSESLNGLVGVSKSLYGYDLKTQYPASVLASASIAASSTTENRVTKSTQFGKEVTMREKAIICIPPKSYKMITEYLILEKPFISCEYPKKRSYPNKFTKESSPLTFLNRIAYSLDKEGKNLKYIENEFWLSELINYTKKDFLRRKRVNECGEPTRQVTYEFNFYAPDKFYNKCK